MKEVIAELKEINKQKGKDYCLKYIDSDLDISEKGLSFDNYIMLGDSLKIKDWDHKTIYKEIVLNNNNKHN